MPIISFLLLTLVGACLSYLFYAGKRGPNTPLLREFYGCTEAETLALVWANGLRWLRNSERLREEGALKGHVAGLPAAFRVGSVHDTFALSLTTDGVYILVDNRRDDNIGTLRFRQRDIRAVTQLHAEDDRRASRLGREETAVNVELYLNTGEYYWLQLPQSAYESLTQTDPSVYHSDKS